MVFIVKDPILSYFNSLSTNFNGFGINLHLLDDYVTPNVRSKLNDFSFKFARILISIPDPTIGALSMTNLEDMNNLFTSASYSTDATTNPDDGSTTPSSASTFFSDIVSLKLKCVFCFIPPTSWLDADGFLVGESALAGYANLILSGILWIRTFNLSADLIELFPEPDNTMFGSVNPKELVIISNRIRDLIITRQIPSPFIKILGPGLGSLLPANKDQELWTESFIYSRKSLDMFSVHANENILDASIYNSGSFNARRLLDDRLRKSVAQMNSISFLNEKIVTSFSTKATFFKKTLYHPQDEPADTFEHNVETNTIKPKVLGDSQEFCLRVVDNFISILTNGFTSTFYDFASLPSNGDDGDADGHTLFNPSGDPRLVGLLMQKLMAKIPIPSNIYRSQEINMEEDFTRKLLLMSTNGNKFCFILNRPVQPDVLAGKLRLTINNPLWSTNYEVKDITVSSFPDAASVTYNTETDDYGRQTITKTVGPGVDLSNVITKATMNLNYMTMFVKGLPYGGCCIFLSGTISLKDPNPPNPPPPPPPPNPNPNPSPGSPPSGTTPVVMQTIMQMPVNFGEPSYTNYATGTIYYDSKTKVVKTFINGTWVTCNLLSFV